MSDKVELKIVKEIRQNNKPYAGKEISDKKGPVIEGEKSIPGYLLALTSVIDFLMGVEDLHAQDYKKVDVKKLEEFSVSEDNNPDKSLTFNIKRNGKVPEGVVPKAINFKKYKENDADFGETVNPVLYNVKQALKEIVGVDLNSVVDIKVGDLLKKFQQTCSDNKIYAKHFEKSKKEGKDVIPPIDPDNVLGRQTVRAIVFVYELMTLMKQFGIVTSFEEYRQFFLKPGTGKFEQKLKEFKKFISGNDKIKNDILAGKNIDDPDNGTIVGNTGEAIIGLYLMWLQGKIGDPNLGNISRQDKIMIRDKVNPDNTDTDVLTAIPAISEAKKILYCARDKDNKRYFETEDPDRMDGKWKKGDIFDQAMERSLGVKEINKDTANKLLALCQTRKTDVNNILLSKDNKTDIGKKYAEYAKVNQTKAKAWQALFNKINSDSRLSDSEKLLKIETQVVKAYEDAVLEAVEKRARNKLKIAEAIYEKVRLDYAKRDLKNDAKVKDHYNSYGIEGVTRSLSDARNKINPEDGKSPDYLGGIIDADNVIQKGYREDVKLRAFDVNKRYDNYKNNIAEIRKIMVENPEDAKKKATALWQDVNKVMVQEEKKYEESVKGAKANDVDVSDIEMVSPRLPEDLKNELLNDIQKMLDEIAQLLDSGSLKDAMAKMKEAIDKAIEFDIEKYQPSSDRYDAAISEYQKIKSKLDVKDKLTELRDQDLKELSGNKEFKFTNINYAGYRILDVQGMLKAAKDQKKAYVGPYESEYNLYIDKFRNALDVKIKELNELKKVASSLAIMIGDCGLVSYDAGTAASMGAARRDLYLLDYRPVVMERGDYDKIKKDDLPRFNKLSNIGKYFAACKRILGNRDTFKDILKKAGEIYNKKLDLALEDQENNDYATFINAMSFEDCLVNEIQGRRLSFAGAAIAQAIAEIKNINVAPDAKKGDFLLGVTHEVLMETLRITTVVNP